MNQNDELKDIFIAEAQDQLEELNRVLTNLEKQPGKRTAVDDFFRVIHTLKGNAAAMGFQGIAELGHTVEDFFTDVRNGAIELDPTDFNTLFKSLDVLTRLIQGLKGGGKVPYKGIQTKLKVLLTNKKGDTSTQPDEKEAIVKTASTTEELSPPREDQVQQEREDVEGDLTNAIQFSDRVQVPVNKLDNLLNLVGELVIERDRLAQMGRNGTDLSRLHRISSDLQYSVMDVRLVQVGTFFNKFHRVVRDTANFQGKKVELILEGTDTEIDRNVLQTISDSLIHMVRNSVSHGIELPEVRENRKKSPSGTIKLKARSESDAVIIDIEDDGNGIDYQRIKKKAIEKGLVLPELAERLGEEELLMYIFEPGFSSAEKIDEISGRGVGLDVVKRAIDSIGGNIKVSTRPEEGTIISLILPSSMAVKGTLLFELNSTEYAIPLTYTESVGSIYKKDIHKVGRGLVTNHQDETISVVFLSDVFDSLSSDRPLGEIHPTFCAIDPAKKLDLVLCAHGGRKLGIIVDKLLQQKEIVEKPLQAPMEDVHCISGVTILGSGNVCLVVNIPSIIQQVFRIVNQLQNNSLVA